MYNYKYMYMCMPIDRYCRNLIAIVLLVQARMLIKINLVYIVLEATKMDKINTVQLFPDNFRNW